MSAQRLRRGMGWIVGLIGAIVILAILFIYSGLYNVGADYPDSAPAAWVMSTTMERSVARHARAVKVPALDDPKMIRAGFRHYMEDCVICHGAPGIEIGEIGRGLNPDPPELTEAAAEWKPNELFWITKHGIRMTGMPAWGKIDSDKETWETIAFVRKLPKMTPEQYAGFADQAPPD